MAHRNSTTIIDFSSNSSNSKNKNQTSPAGSGGFFTPNFVLLGYAPASANANFVSDFLPSYQLNQLFGGAIIITTESLKSLVWHSRIVLVCVLSLFAQILSSSAYQGYLMLSCSYQLVMELPSGFSLLKQKTLILLEMLSEEKAREFWWLEVRLDLAVWLKKFKQILSITWQITRKFYLAAVVFVCIGLLNVIATTSSSNQSSDSYLARFLDANTLVEQTQPSDQKLPFLSLTVNAADTSKETVKKITAHEVREAETIEKIAELYSLQPKTVAFNNNLEIEAKLNSGQKLYLPWRDGYIYNASEDISAEDLAKKYNLDKNTIVEENRASFDQEAAKFHKDTLILLSTTDFDGVKKINEEEEQRKKNLKELEEQRKKILDYTAVSKVTETGAGADQISNSDQSNSSGFIWPSKGTISRCVQPGHIACDIANFSMPPVYSVKDGVVLEAGWKDGGFGNRILISHGNGIKTMYMHLSEVYVSRGQILKQGQAIGRMGSTGNSTGIHLHFEVWLNDVRQNPLAYLP